MVLSRCAVVTRLPVCCCIAFGSLEGTKFTWTGQNKHNPTEGILQYLIGMEEEVLTTNPTRATLLEHRIISYQWIDSHWERALYGVRSTSNGGNAPMSRKQLEPCSFSLSKRMKHRQYGCKFSSTVDFISWINIDADTGKNEWAGCIF